MSTTHKGKWTELDSRRSDGLSVSLQWCAATGQVKVVVADDRCPEVFELEVAGADALEAFHHPFAIRAGLARSTRSADSPSVQSAQS